MVAKAKKAFLETFYEVGYSPWEVYKMIGYSKGDLPKISGIVIEKVLAMKNLGVNLKRDLGLSRKGLMIRESDLEKLLKALGERLSELRRKEDSQKISELKVNQLIEAAETLGYRSLYERQPQL